MESVKIAVLAGTVREERKSIAAAKYVARVGESLDGVEVRFADPQDFVFKNEGEDGKDSKFTELTAWADAFFIVSPEYNHSYPGSLKRMLDSEFDNYLHKPVALAGVSSGPWGGVRMIEALLPVLRTLKLVPISYDVQVPFIGEAFDESGNPTDAGLEDRVKRTYGELIWFAKAFKRAKLDG